MKKFMTVLLLCLACTCCVAALSACNKTVSVEGITMAESAVTLEIGDEYQIQYDIYPAESSDKGVVFTSSNQNIITVNSDGKVCAVAEGKAQVTAVTNDGGFSVICAFTVNEKSYTVTYYADGVAVSTQRYTLSDPSVDEPSPPQKAGYTASWQSYSLGAENVIVNAVYVPIEYEAVFKDADGAVVYTAVYTVESTSVIEPSVPAREHYVGSWSSYTLSIGGVSVYPVYTPEEYKAEFVADGKVVSTAVYTVENWSVQVPEVPAKDGYTSAWESFTLDYGGITVRAVYTPITYKAEFTANGAAVATVSFTVEDEKIAAPDVPSRDGYTGEWESFEITCGDIAVQAVYTPIVYTITYENCKDAENSNSVTYTVEDNVVFGSLSVERYNFVGWYLDGEKIGSTVGLWQDITLTAEWEAIEYRVIFCYENHDIYQELYYTTDNLGINEPAVPEKEGYTGVWGSYFFNYETAYVMPVYTLVSYTATFVASDVTVDAVCFTVEDETISAPAVPLVDGYTGEWESYNICGEDITVKAVYSPIVYNITYENCKGAENGNAATYTVESAVTFNALSLEHYTFSGWYLSGEKIASTAGLCRDIVVEAEWEAAKYRVVFCYESHDTYKEVYYSADDMSIDEPTVPEKTGYTGEWEGYTLDFETAYVMPVYTLAQYTATFVANGVTVDTVSFTVENETISEPKVPSKNGYTGEWESYSLTCSNITVNAAYSPLNYSITYENCKDAENCNPATYTAENDVTFTALSLEHYTFLGWYVNSTQITSTAALYCDLTLTAKWKATEYSITFCDENGKALEIVYYTVEDTTIEEPTVQSKDGYTGTWESYSLTGGNITVNAAYSLVNYNITYENCKGAANSNPSTYSAENEVTFEELSLKHYTFLGWYLSDTKITSTRGLYSDLTLTAKWQAIEYTVTFLSESGDVVETVSYTVEDAAIVEPDVPVKSGYTGTWESYSLIGGNITVNAIYTAVISSVEVTVTFVADGQTVAKVVYIDGVAQDKLPDVPEKTGYTGEWESFTVVDSDLTVNAVYTAESVSNVFTYEENSDGTLTVIGYTGEGGVVTVPSEYDGKTVTGVSSAAFSGNTDISELVLPSTITALDGGVFAGMSGLTAITVPYIGSANNTATSCLGYYFGTESYSGGTATKQYYNTSSTTYVTYYLPSELTSVTVLGGKLYYGAFWGCSTLTEIIIREDVTTINEAALGGLSSLVNLTLPFVGSKSSSTRASFTTLFGYIFGETEYSGGVETEQYYSASGSPYTYYIPRTLKNVTITGGSINYGAFWGCSNITSVTIGAGVSYIGAYAFSGCSSSISVTSEADVSWTVNGQTIAILSSEDMYDALQKYEAYAWELAE